MEKPDVYILSQVDWQFWCTFTFKADAVSSEKLRQSLWFALMRDWAGWYRVDFNRLLWMRRAEEGESTARLHWHALVAGLPNEAKSRATCFSVKNDWERLGGGLARVYLYEGSRNALSYMLKQPGIMSVMGSDGKPKEVASYRSDGAAAYESRKFGSSGAVTYSEGLIRLLDRRRGASRKVRQVDKARLRVSSISATQKNQVVVQGSLSPSLLRKGVNGSSCVARRQALPE